MKTGDPKKAVVLAVVALVVLGVAVFQILPKGEPAAARKAPLAAEPAESDDVGALIVSAQERLQKDPFIHPKLQKGDPKDEAAKGDNPPKNSKPPSLEDGSGSLPGTFGTNPFQPPNPDVNAGQSQQSNGVHLKDSRIQVMVEAIVSVQRTKAFIRVGAEDARGYAEGQSLPGVGTITQIGEASVTIRTPKGSKTLQLGKEKKI